MNTAATDMPMLRELLEPAGLDSAWPGAELRIADITTDSARVRDGSLFLACQGFKHHGLEFVDAAVDAGAAAILWEPVADVTEPRLPDSVIAFPVPDLGDEVGAIADRFFRSPSSQIVVTGVTGTNGKTTTAWLASQALKRLGRVSGYMGTLGFGIGDEMESSALTTPGVIAVHRRLRKLVDAGATTVVMEVSSHGLDQGRVDAVQIAIAAFTNLSRDHLDYHGDMQAYKDTKAKLFALQSVEQAVLNVGDPFGAELAANWQGTGRLLKVALAEQPDAAADLVMQVLGSGPDGLHLSLSYGDECIEMHSRLWGRFNAENLLVAAGILLAHGCTLQEAGKALADCTPPPGRMQIVRGSAADAPMVVVDFAHTPDALEQALLVLREHCSGAVSVVFGCGGERDQGKRGEMGSVARRLANRIIVTDDNPRNEDPDEIVKAILAGMSDHANVEVVRDRAAAIAAGVAAAGMGDVVLVAGKGSEDYQLVAADVLPFSDVAEARRALRVQE